MGMTIAEKILAKKGGLKHVGPGDLVTVEVDTVILFDNNFMTNRWREILRVKDPDRIIVVFDHRVPAATQASAVAQKIGREFVAKFGVKRFHDVGYSQGISHQLVADHGYALPGSVRSEEHTSELQSRLHLVCRLLLENNKTLLLSPTANGPAISPPLFASPTMSR